MTKLYVGEIKTGDEVVLDDGFICTIAGIVAIEEDEGGKFFRCREGRHYITGQLDENGCYVGMFKKE